MASYKKVTLCAGAANRWLLAAAGNLVWLRLLPDNRLAVANKGKPWRKKFTQFFYKILCG